MREILFRGKTKNELPSRWVYGSLADVGQKYFIDDYQDNSRVITETIGQYTGRKDVNGRKIFDGDICRVTYLEKRYNTFNDGKETYDDYTEMVEQVVYSENHCCYMLKTQIDDIEMIRPLNDLSVKGFTIDKIEVIGNIFDNKELLDETKC